jgi:YidC/Oxa1 family membrane protein insertase
MAMLMISYLIWEAWQIDYGPKPQAIISDKPVVADKEQLPTGTDSALNNVQPPANTPATVVAATPSNKVITVKTDVVSIEIDTEGGTLRNLDLVQYPTEKENEYVNKAYALIGMRAPAKNLTPIRLLDGSQEHLFLAQNGLVADNNSAPAPDHHAIFSAGDANYVMQPGEEQISVPLSWTDGQGLQVSKTYTFKRGSYVIDLDQKIINQSAKPWTGRQYDQLMRIEHSDKTNNFIRTFSGGVVYTDKEKFKKIKYENMEDNLNLTEQGGWSGMIQHYFASAWIPPADQENHFYTKALSDKRFVIGSYSSDQTIPSNSQGEFKARFFAGPKIQPLLEAITPGLELTVDYSWLTVIAKPIYFSLNYLHNYLDNWGVAILGVTFIIKFLFFPLSKASYQSMAKMRKVQPLLKELQERYADDKQKFNTEMMSLYKREKVNPLGGCLPIMVQIPVFISLYWVLIETVELRQADFALWIQDLSAQDPFYILPIIYGITMKIQQSLNPAPIDPLQAKVMKMFPIVFTVFFLFFPSGLVLYWICNNSLSIIQQWYITKHILEEKPHAH